MDKLPKVSVITVVWNDVQHIEQTMLSVLEQTYPNIEYLVIDGASSDGTWDLVCKYKDKLAYCISEEDKGLYDAMNKGITKMSGEWCFFMNSGDSFFTSQTVMDVLKDYIDNGESVIYGDIVRVNHGVKELIKARANVNRGKEPMPSFHQALFTRSIEMKQHPFDLRYKIIADYAFYYLLAKRNCAYKYVPIIISNYDANGLSAQQNDLIIREKLKLYARNLDIKSILYMLIIVKRNLMRLFASM